MVIVKEAGPEIGVVPVRYPPAPPAPNNAAPPPPPPITTYSTVSLKEGGALKVEVAVKV
jgi:hypothetical protein